ncbi:MAG: galactose oxidase [Parabacteroides sp.]|nr:galactose oxidase [Parabacteroides sp.]
MTHKRLFALLIALLPVFVSSCSDDDDDDLIGNWVRTSDFDGLARGEASCFSIGNKGYLVCGYDGSKSNTRLGDLWEYDMTTDAWTQKASFPGTARSNATAFAIDGKGYFGTGYDGENRLNDFWEYDPATNTWTQKADFPGTGRYSAVSFGISGKGYIGAGYDGNYLKDFYSFTPANNTWTQIASVGGSKRMGASSFVIDNIAYVCGGANNGEYVSDFWKFDPSTGQWTQLRDIANTSNEDYDDDYTIARMNASTFVIDGAAYLTCGESGSLRSDTWKYYPSTDLWEQVHNFKGSARTEAVSFSNGTRGFIATGKSSTYRFDDIWELHPYDYDPDDE